MASVFFLFFLSQIPAVLIAAGLVGVCLGTFLFIRGFMLLQRRRLILDTPFSKIRSASLGLVEVSGLATGPYTITAPVTERPCFFYDAAVWEWKKQGDDKKWVKVVGERVHVPFFLDDNTGEMLVDPSGAELDLHRDFHEEFSDSLFTTKDAIPGNIHKFLANHGIVTSNKIRVEEYCIKPKNALFILGTLAENPGLEVSSRPIRETENSQSVFGLSVGLGRESLPMSSSTMELTPPSFKRLPERTQAGPQKLQVIRLTPEDAPQGERTQQQRITAALLRAGITNPVAWEAAGVGPTAVEVSPHPAEGQASADPAATSGHDRGAGGFELHPPVVLMKGENQKSFMISWRSQQAVARSLGWKAALMIWGGPAIALAGLYLLVRIWQVL